MKNLPEHEVFKALESRLSNYTEEPDDAVWQNISAGLPSNRRPWWMVWSDRATMALVLAAVVWAGYEFATVQPGSSPVMTASGVDTFSDASKVSVDDTRVEKGATASGEKDGASVNRGEDSNKPSTVSKLSEQRAVQRDGSSNSSSTPPVVPEQRAVQSNASFEKDSRGTKASSRVNNSKVPQAKYDVLRGVDSRDNPIELLERNSELLATENSMTSESLAQEQPLINMETSSSVTRTLDGEATADSLTVAVQPKADSAMASEEKHVFNPKKKRKKGVTVYGFFTPTLSFYSVTPVAQDAMAMKKFSSPSVLSSDRLGIALDIGLQGHVANRLEYVAGLSYYKQAQTLTYTYQAFGDVVVDEGGSDGSFTVNPQTSEASLSYTMHNVGVQVGLFYTLAEHKVVHKLGATLQYQRGLYQGKEGDTYVNQATDYLGYRVMYRVEFPVHPKVMFIFQPTLDHAFWTNESLNAPFSLKSYRAGIGIGLTYRF